MKAIRDAEQALALVTNGDVVDLLFSDIVMPWNLNGLDLARSLRQRFPQIPVLLATGYSDEASRASQEGFAILPKPIAPTYCTAPFASSCGHRRSPPDRLCYASELRHRARSIGWSRSRCRSKIR